MPYRRRSGFRKFLVSFRQRIGIAALLVLVVVAVVAISLLVRSSLTKEKVVSQKAPFRLALAELQEPADASSEMSGKYFGLSKKNSIHSVEMAPPPVEVSAVSPAGPVERVDAPPRRLNKNSELVDNPPRHPSSGSPAEDSAGMISEPLGTVPGPSVLPQFYSGPSYLPYSSIGGETTPNGGGTAANGGGTAPNGGGTTTDGGGTTKDGGGTTPNNETTPIVTPEPGTFLLVGAGVVVIGLYRLFRRKRTKLD